jgi:hypothetical protein
MGYAGGAAGAGAGWAGDVVAPGTAPGAGLSFGGAVRGGGSGDPAIGMGREPGRFAAGGAAAAGRAVGGAAGFEAGGGFAAGRGIGPEGERKSKTSPQSGHVRLAAPFTASVVKTCVQTGLGHGNVCGMTLCSEHPMREV